VDSSEVRQRRGISELAELADVLASPLSDVAKHFSVFLSGWVSHSALVILAVDDVGHPRKQHGDAKFVSAISLSELDAVSSSLSRGEVRRGEWPLAGEPRASLASLARTGALLVMTDPGDSESDELVFHFWQILALQIHQQAREASPVYLMESRAASSVRAEAVTELADRYTTTLESMLAVLRSSSIDDRAARQVATNLATEAAVHLRTATDRVLTFTDEPVATAFERLRDDLRPLVKYRDIDVQFVEPPVDGRALPSEVAHGARAVVRGAILALVDQPAVSRVRVQWDCDGKNLLIKVRDDGPGDLSAESAQLQPLQQRVLALNGQLSLSATSGWGSEMSVFMPLDPPSLRNDDSVLSTLSSREREVIQLIATGRRNRRIALDLGISENTIKFHVSKIFRKLGVSSRAELTALVADHRSPFNPPAPAKSAD